MRVFENILYVFVGITIATLMVVIITCTKPQYNYTVYPITITEYSGGVYNINQNDKDVQTNFTASEVVEYKNNLEKLGYTVILK